jgi:hypothetical protein
MDVYTQTYDAIEPCVQVDTVFPNNINLIVNDIPLIGKNEELYKVNKIMNQYHKEYNENGMSIIKCDDECKIRAAEDAIMRLACIGLKPPYWLYRRVKKS